MDRYVQNGCFFYKDKKSAMIKILILIIFLSGFVEVFDSYLFGASFSRRQQKAILNRQHALTKEACPEQRQSGRVPACLRHGASPKLLFYFFHVAIN
jgi:hypothetical protein